MTKQTDLANIRIIPKITRFFPHQVNLEKEFTFTKGKYWNGTPILRESPFLDISNHLISYHISYNNHILYHKIYYPDKILISGPVLTSERAKSLALNGSDIIRIDSGCFLGSAEVLMSNGTAKNINKIKQGDIIIDKDGKPTRVLRKINNGQKQLYRLTNKHFNVITYVTGNHQYYVYNYTTKEFSWKSIDFLIDNTDLYHLTTPIFTYENIKYQIMMLMICNIVSPILLLHLGCDLNAVFFDIVDNKYILETDIIIEKTKVYADVWDLETTSHSFVCDYVSVHNSSAETILECNNTIHKYNSKSIIRSHNNTSIPKLLALGCDFIEASHKIDFDYIKLMISLCDSKSIDEFYNNSEFIHNLHHSLPPHQ